MIRSEFIAAIKQVATERGIKPEDVIDTLKRAMIAAYRKDYPEEAASIEDISVEIDKRNGEVTLFHEGADITPPGFGRIAAQTAKQVILQGVREAEKQAVVDEFRDRIGRVTPAMLQRFERGKWFVDVGRTIALMPREEQVFSEEYRMNLRLKVFIKTIIDDPIRPEIIVSRSDPKLVSALFEIEVPEVQSGAVVVKGVAREAGSRTKIAVVSTQEGVDPVGSMVGQRGVRVQAVTNELQGEKMDIILWSNSPTKYIINALSPAKVSDVEIDEEKNHAQVEVKEDQLSLAIGKDGQNVRLASKLTGFRIDIVNESGALMSSPSSDSDQPDDADAPDDGTVVGELDGLSSRTRSALRKSNITSRAELLALDPAEIANIPGIGPKAIAEINALLKSPAAD